jgi:amino acid adenylation domain-containing protein
MTYGELDRLANQFAHLLRALGVTPGDRVGVQVPRSGRAVAALLGAARAGAVYVPLDPGSPPARVKLIARDCGLRHVIMTPELLELWLAAGAGAPVEHVILAADGAVQTAAVQVTTWDEVTAVASDAIFPVSQSEVDLAYLLYTSGSTGVPKGVMISHRNALAFVHWAAATANLCEHDRVASVAPFHFDLSVFDLWSTLSCGATVVIVDEATVKSGPRMIERVREQNISVWYSVPSAIMLMLEAGLETLGAPSLRVVYFAGEVFPVRQLRRAMLALPHARFFNLFGPTETNVCLAYEVPEPPAEGNSITSGIPIGRPACGDEIAIVADDGRVAVDDEVGELLVEGPTVMLGYWNGGTPKLAAHPYRTGDFVSRRADGEIVYHGRRDHMVKVRGFRIELGEVEAALSRHPLIREAVAFVLDGELAAVARPEDPSLTVLAVRRFLAERLPVYMIPTQIRLVAELPHTSSGKADRMRIQSALAAHDVVVLPPAYVPHP